jgi:hypothetical protein
MDRAAIVERLGQPTRKTDREHWEYAMPPGRTCRVVFAGDALKSAEIDTPSPAGGPARKADIVRIDTKGSSTWRPVDAVKVVAARLADLPPIDQARLDAEYEVLRTAWGPLNVGPADEICVRLAADLESDAAVLRAFEGFLITPAQDESMSVYSFFEPPGSVRGQAVAYRIWRLADGRTAMVRSSTQAPPPGEDRAYILYTGPEPAMDEIHKIARVFQQDTGKSLNGLPLRIVGTARQPDVGLIRKIIALDEEAERLSPGSSQRVIASSVAVDGAPRYVATVYTDERNPWVRSMIPQHLANVGHDGNACARRPGWATLTSASAMAFVANAQDGAVRHFDDVHVLVSTFAETEDERIRALMPGGYLTWADDVWAAAGGMSGNVDLAHWILGTGSQRCVVHLCYITASSPRTIMWPWDLLSAAEQEQASRRA